jgi:AraC-like DNA-binding protein
MAIINYIEKHLKTFSVKYHIHQYWEIIYVTEGSGCIKDASGQSYNYKKGETICIPPLFEHANFSEEGFKNIHFTIEDWSATVKVPFIIPASDFSKDFYTALKLTYRYFHQLPPSDPINLNLTNIIVSFLDNLIQKSNAYNITQTIVHEIINHYTDASFDIDQAYNLVPLSKEYIRKLFIKEHGISPTKFLLQKRITLSKQLLSNKDNNLRINEIAKTCGFTDHAYFCRIFKKETGVNPNDFQLNLLKENKIYSS